nr:MAG TPA: hypothetical protein [Caudoviricetes sp.]
MFNFYNGNTAIAFELFLAFVARLKVSGSHYHFGNRTVFVFELVSRCSGQSNGFRFSAELTANHYRVQSMFFAKSDAHLLFSYLHVLERLELPNVTFNHVIGNAVNIVMMLRQVNEVHRITIVTSKPQIGNPLRLLGETVGNDNHRLRLKHGFVCPCLTPLMSFGKKFGAKDVFPIVVGEILVCFVMLASTKHGNQFFGHCRFTRTRSTSNHNKRFHCVTFCTYLLLTPPVVVFNCS